MTVEELTTTVARYLGEERTRTSFDSYALTRGISIDPKAEADFQLLRYAEHLLASAIGAASSRLVLSLLLRKRTVSTKAALKLLDDANAAIHYNREILQTALDHVRQGIAVFDKELHLVCWNWQFGEILALPPQLTRVGTALDHILRFHVEHSTLDRRRSTTLVRERLARYVASSEPFLERFAERDLVMEVRANPMPDGGIVTTFTDITPSVKAAEELERANELLERRVQERTEELTRLNNELGRAKAEAEQANISKTTVSRRGKPRHPAAAQRRAPLRHQPGRAAKRAAAMPSSSATSTPRSTRSKKYSERCSTFRASIPAP